MQGLDSVSLVPVDRVEVTIVMDTFVDVLMAGGEGVRRFPLAYEWSDASSLVAEHGFSAHVTVEVGGTRSSVLYDGGLTPDGLRRNLDVIGIDAKQLRALVMSHGHIDHHGGLEGLFSRYGRSGLPLIIHPDAWRDRKISFPGGLEVHMPPPSKADLEHEGVEVVEAIRPTLLLDGTMLVSGQVERTTDFETGFPMHQALAAGGVWEPDPMILDDQNLVLHVRDKGLVVVSGCSHSGAINVLRNARRITGVDEIAGFVGGFHLTGAVFEPIIERTVKEFVSFDVKRLVPAHCTGWKAVHYLARTMPNAFAQPSVGTTFVF